MKGEAGWNQEQDHDLEPPYDVAGANLKLSMCLRIVEIYVSTIFLARISMYIGARLENYRRSSPWAVTLMVLRRICSMVLWQIVKSGIMRGSVEFAISVDRRIEHIKESLGQETRGRPAH